MTRVLAALHLYGTRPPVSLPAPSYAAQFLSAVTTPLQTAAGCFGGHQLSFIEPDGSIWPCPSRHKIAATPPGQHRTIRGHHAAELFSPTRSTCPADCPLQSVDCISMWPLTSFDRFLHARTPMTADTSSAWTAVHEALAAMPDPMAGAQARKYEEELAAFLGGEVIAVSSGTAALHAVLAASGIGPGDEVLVPALSVVMSAAPVTYTGATPVFFDCTPNANDVSYKDLTAKITPRTKAIMPVYLWRRTNGAARLAAFAASRGLRVLEDACLAIGSRCEGKLAGTLGDAGCFSTKDGKLVWSGEGGAIRTADPDPALAARCHAYRTHWQAPPPGQAPLSAIGAQLPPRRAARRHRPHQPGPLPPGPGPQAAADTPPVPPHRGSTGNQHHARRTGWNSYAPLARLDLPRPREFSRYLAGLGVPNSTGTYHLVACDQRPMFTGSRHAPCPNAAAVLESLLAVVVTDHDDDKQIRR